MNATKNPQQELKKYIYDSNNQRNALVLCSKDSHGNVVISWSAVSGGDTYSEHKALLACWNRLEKNSNKIVPQRLHDAINWMRERAAKNFKISQDEVIVVGRWVEDLNEYRKRKATV